MVLDKLHPFGDMLVPGKGVKAAVNFDAVEVAREIRQGVKVGATTSRVDAPLPVRVRPTGDADANQWAAPLALFATSW